MRAAQTAAFLGAKLADSQAGGPASGVNFYSLARVRPTASLAKISFATVSSCIGKSLPYSSARPPPPSHVAGWRVNDVERPANYDAGEALFNLARILVIEDDPETAAEIASCLAASGFEAEQSFDGAEGLALALDEPFDAVTLDRMLPGCDGLDVVKRLREAGSDVPVLMVSALGDVDDRVVGLRAGGDDYLVKPFAPPELIARLEVILRRRRRPEETEVMLRAGDLKLDLVRREAERDGRRIELLPQEFKLLEFMMRNAGQTLSRRQIFEAVWEYYFDPGTNLIDVHVGRLRRKIDAPGLPPLFKTERGVGYMLDAT